MKRRMSGGRISVENTLGGSHPVQSQVVDAADGEHLAGVHHVPSGGFREGDRADQVLRQAALQRSGEGLGVGVEEPNDRGLGLRRPS